MSLRTPQEWAISDASIVRPADFDPFSWGCCGYKKMALLEMLKTRMYPRQITWETVEENYGVDFGAN